MLLCVAPLTPLPPHPTRHLLGRGRHAAAAAAGGAATTLCPAPGELPPPGVPTPRLPAQRPPGPEAGGAGPDGADAGNVQLHAGGWRKRGDASREDSITLDVGA